MKDGIKQKDGVIVSTDTHLDYYTGPTDASRRKLMNPVRENCRVQTLKSDDPVTVANNHITVTVYPNGSIEIKPVK